MTLTDLLLFFVGDADAIRRLAADPWTPAVGALLVLAAGLARHHDTHDLRRQWWRLLIPFAVSTLATAVLFLVVVLIARGGRESLPLGWSLLGLFWLTAPLAWLYGLPFERIWPQQQAARARRWALAAVATARVALLTRCVSVLLGYGWFAALQVVLCFAVPVVLLAVAAALLFVRQPESAAAPPPPSPAAAVGEATGRVVEFMGVVPNTVPNPARDDLVETIPWPEPPDVSLGVNIGCLGVGVLLASTCFWPFGPPPNWPPTLLSFHTEPPGLAVWVTAAATVLFWLPWLLLHQPLQRRRTQFVERLREGELATALRDLAELQPGDFPPNWAPGAVLAREDFASRMLDATLIAGDLPRESWVRARFLGPFLRMFPWWVDPDSVWLEHGDRMPKEQLQKLATLRDLLQRLPEAQKLLQPFAEYLGKLREYTQERDPPREEIIEDLLVLAAKRGDQR